MDDVDSLLIVQASQGEDDPRVQRDDEEAYTGDYPGSGLDGDSRPDRTHGGEGDADNEEDRLERREAFNAGHSGFPLDPRSQLPGELAMSFLLEDLRGEPLRGRALLGHLDGAGPRQPGVPSVSSLQSPALPKPSEGTVGSHRVAADDLAILSLCSLRRLLDEIRDRLWV